MFTHEHQDHYHLDSLKVILEKNPQAKIYANNTVSELLKKEGIDHILVNHLGAVSLDGVEILGIGEHHAQMHSSIPLSSNLGFFIDKQERVI